MSKAVRHDVLACESDPCNCGCAWCFDTCPDNYGNVPHFTLEELGFLHSYLITGEMSQDEPSFNLYMSILEKLDRWKFPDEV